MNQLLCVQAIFNNYNFKDKFQQLKELVFEHTYWCVAVGFFLPTCHEGQTTANHGGKVPLD